ncbi:Ribosomal RNA small subunit methyltransferase H [Candidatus Protochlamydia amoebophila]|uniref:16S rRNA (cytosine(1402)-N(4))-methyltransferase RsmH n=1 Tax=Candidatus Protochlamydia amoebophila TaxID=362787 RepID=UPI001BC9625D|nr:16S rRNA (cytosine(1402)-N(4))-methyltransferase RsmH [Candidatus Protochlamydia amoebophila]MBS4164380.1 Ribosomal RNA small subunit methyltransferase H [Candidatus Protochlamydia amoebophila]
MPIPFYPHRSVLLEEVIEAFQTVQLKVFIDGTLGAGGHAEAILEHHPEIELYLGIDQDSNALNIANKRLEKWKQKILLKQGNFSQFDIFLKEIGFSSMDGLLVDLGVSSMQLDQPERGFSFSKDGPLDMRMNPEGKLTAADIVNTWSEHDLGKIFRDYGEEKKWRLAARTIVQARQVKQILTTTDLANLLKPVFAWNPKKGINPLTLIFQALRICVNRELDVLEQLVSKTFDYLKPGGRVAVISFHSLEDRIVKNELRLAASDKWETTGLGSGLFRDKKPVAKLVNRKPICPHEKEIKENPRSRSAKFRIAEKLEG